MNERGSALDGFDADLRQRLFARPHAEDERRIAEAFAERLDTDDSVTVVGVNSGIYGLVAAERVGPENVRLFDDDADRLEAATELLAAAGYDGVETNPVAEWDDHAAAATVLVVEETRVGDDFLDSVSPSALRYLLVKSDDVSLQQRLAEDGYLTNRLRDFRPLGTPWERIVEAAWPDNNDFSHRRLRWTAPERVGDSVRYERPGLRERVSDVVDEAMPDIDSKRSLLATVAYTLYRLPIAVVYAVLTVAVTLLPNPLLGLLLLASVVVYFLTVVTAVGIGFNYGLEAAGVSGVTVRLSVALAVAFMILTSPVWLFGSYALLVTRLPDPEAD